MIVFESNPPASLLVLSIARSAARKIEPIDRVAQLGILIFSFATCQSFAAGSNEVITSGAAILSLTADQAARNIPVLVTGVVTLAEADWGGRFFVQDSSSGVFVNSTKEPPPRPGDVVEISGVTDPGNYSPVIMTPRWEKMGTAPLPVAKPVSVERFLSGAEDGQRIEVSGAVKSAQAGELRIALELESGTNHFQVFAPISVKVDLNSLKGAKVHLRGTAAASRESQRGLTPYVAVYLPQNADLIVDEAQAGTVTGKPLSTAAALLALTPDQAAGATHVSITGVVTVAEPNWGGDFYVQDSTGGVLVNNQKETQPAVGDLVEVSGFSHAAGYAPDVIESHWKKLGTAPLPAAKPVSVERLSSGVEHGRRVEVSAVVRSVHPSQITKSRLAVELTSRGYRFRASLPTSAVADPISLVGATVRLRGTAATSFNKAFRQSPTVEMLVPGVSDFIVEQLPGSSISQQPVTPLNKIAEYCQNGASETRLRVSGVVTYQRPGEDIFLHDGNADLQVKCVETNVFAAGEIVEAIGFAGSERFLPVLQDAALVRTTRFEEPIVPQKVTVPELLQGFHHSGLISLQGKVLDCSLRQLRSAHSLSNAPGNNILTLQNGAYFFSVQAPGTRQFAQLASIPIGSTLEVAGICMLQPDEQGKMESARLLLLDPASIRILQRPNWWTPERTRLWFGIFVAVSLLGAGALYGLHRIRLARISARMNLLVEIQSKERKRIAQELHDTLLQGFTGIGLKLDAVTHGLPPSLTATKEQLQNLLEQSDEYLVETRRAVWKLRSPSLEELNDLSEALKKVSGRAIQGNGIRLSFRTSGAARKLPEAVEDNLLRICEEGVANAARHARPTKVEVVLEYTSNELRLRVRDDGCGFDPPALASAKDGHFGLVGIRDRAKSMGGSLSLTSHPGQGTELDVTVPLPALG
jgi:signal transduction histidine kinase